MRSTDMAVVISQSQNEVAEMAARGLDIKPHRKRMVEEKGGAVAVSENHATGDRGRVALSSANGAGRFSGCPAARVGR